MRSTHGLSVLCAEGPPPSGRDGNFINIDYNQFLCGVGARLQKTTMGDTGLSQWRGSEQCGGYWGCTMCPDFAVVAGVAVFNARVR
jgi:hypothetical protein